MEHALTVFGRMAGLCAFLVLAGCKVGVVADIDLIETIAVAAGEQTDAQATGELRIALPAGTKCKDRQGRLENVLRGYFVDAALLSCKMTRSGGQAHIAVKLPVVANYDAWKEAGGSLFALIPQPMEEGIQVNLMFDPDSGQALNEALREIYGTGVDIGDVAVAIRLLNGSEKLMLAQLSGSIIEGEPAISFKRFFVPAGENVEVVLGSVKVAYMHKQGFVPVVQVLVPGGVVPARAKERTS